MDMQKMIEAVQAALGVTVDGRPGPETWGAIHAAVVKPQAKRKAGAPARLEELGAVDERSEKHIATLHPPVRNLARALVQKAAANNIQIKVISGLRSFAEQDALYAQGRSKPGNIVTKARGGYSNHNFGIAFDIGVFEGQRYLGSSPKYKAVGVLGMELGLEWGGNWKTIVDEPHFQLRPAWASGLTESAMLAAFRDRQTAGQEIYA